jgi:hypothetical protein
MFTTVILVHHPKSVLVARNPGIYNIFIQTHVMEGKVSRRLALPSRAVQPIDFQDIYITIMSHLRGVIAVY